MMARRRYIPALLAVAALLAVPGPASAGEVDAADLVGTWEHVAISNTPDGEPEPVDTAKISWTFEADGSGAYHQTVPMLNRTDSSPMFWELDGDAIELYRKKGKKPNATYTVIEYSGSSMVWRNEKLGDYYHVEKRE